MTKLLNSLPNTHPLQKTVPTGYFCSKSISEKCKIASEYSVIKHSVEQHIKDLLSHMQFVTPDLGADPPERKTKYKHQWTLCMA